MIAGNKEEVTDLPKVIADRIRVAIAYRKQCAENTNAYRVVFSEADFLPGLIIDRYNDVISVQILTQAMDQEPVRGAIIETLVEELKPEGILERVEPRIRDLEQLPPHDSALLWGKKTSTIIQMNNVRFHYDAHEGQKTEPFSTNEKTMPPPPAVRKATPSTSSATREASPFTWPPTARVSPA